MQVNLDKTDLINLVRWAPMSDDLVDKYKELGWGSDCYNIPFSFHDHILEELSEQELWNLYLECKQSYDDEVL